MSNDEEIQDPTAGILADLADLKAHSQQAADEHQVDDDVRARLDRISAAAATLREDDDDMEPDAQPDERAQRAAGITLPDADSGPAFGVGMLNFSAAPTPQRVDEETEEAAGVLQPESFDDYNPFSFSAARAQTPEPPEAPAPTVADPGLLFQAPQVELGELADPDWSPAEEETEPAVETDEGEDAESAGQDDAEDSLGAKKRRRGGRGRRSKRDRAEDENQGENTGDGDEPAAEHHADKASAEAKDGKGDKDSKADKPADEDSGSGRRRHRRRERDRSGASARSDEVTGVKGSTRLEAKRQRRQEGRAAGRRRPLITEAEFLARRESVERKMLVRRQDGRTQLVVLEDGIAVEHYLSEDRAQASLIGNVYLGKVQNVLPSMEAAFIDIGKGRNAVLYAGEVNWDALGMDGKPRRIELALKPGDSVLVQVTKDPIGHKGARLTAQISLPGRFLVFVPGNTMTGISRKLPDVERHRLKKLLKEIVPTGSGVIVRTAAEGAAEEELRHDVERLSKRWEKIEAKTTSTKVLSPALLYSEPDMILRIVRDVFNEDFAELVVSGDKVEDEIHEYVETVAPDLAERLKHYEGEEDIFAHYRVDEQIEKALNRLVHLPSGGSLVIDRTEAMTVIDVNTGKFTGSGGNLEETVTKNNLEAAEEVIRQLRLRDIGGIIVVDFIDMVLEANRDLVVRRLVECLGRDRTKHQVAEVTSLGLVQMTRKRIGTGLAEGFAAAGEDFTGRGLMLPGTEPDPNAKKFKSRKAKDSHHDKKHERKQAEPAPEPVHDEVEASRSAESRNAMAAIAKATIKKAGDAGGEPAAPAAEEPAAPQAEAKPKRTRRSRRKKADEAPAPLFDAPVSESTPAADAAPAEQSAPVVEATPEPVAEPEPEQPKGPAPLMIGGEQTTKVQVAEAAPKRPVKRAPRKQPVAAPESEPVTTGFLIIGQD